MNNWLKRCSCLWYEVCSHHLSPHMCNFHALQYQEICLTHSDKPLNALNAVAWKCLPWYQMVHHLIIVYSKSTIHLVVALLTRFLTHIPQMVGNSYFFWPTTFTEDSEKLLCKQGSGFMGKFSKSKFKMNCLSHNCFYCFIHSAREVRSSGSILLISITVEMVHRHMFLWYLVWPTNSSMSISTFILKDEGGPCRSGTALFAWLLWDLILLDTHTFLVLQVLSDCFQGLRDDRRKGCPRDSQVCRHAW